MWQCVVTSRVINFLIFDNIQSSLSWASCVWDSGQAKTLHTVPYPLTLTVIPIGFEAYVFTDWLPLLAPHQQCQSTEGKYLNPNCTSVKISRIHHYLPNRPKNMSSSKHTSRTESCFWAIKICEIFVHRYIIIQQGQMCRLIMVVVSASQSNRSQQIKADLAVQLWIFYRLAFLGWL